jgi:hypothetical protein
MTLEEIYISRPQFSDYNFDKFSSRLTTICKQIKEKNNRKADDEKAFALFKSNNKVHYYSRKGFIKWQGSESQELALQDLSQGLHDLSIRGTKRVKGGYQRFYDSRPQHYEEFDFKTFCDKIGQEIKTKKYLHTLRVRGKLHIAS